MSASLGTSDSLARSVGAADALLQDPDRDPPFEPVDTASARAAIERLAERFASADGWVKAVIEGARAGAQGLSSDHLQGLSEIVQNADDAAASSLHVTLENDALLVTHDGVPLTLTDAFALAAPWVTTKGGNATATGRFGIGLMTLQTLSPTLEVYSGYYRIRLGDPTISFIDHPDLPDHFIRPGDTVLRVPCKPGVLDEEALVAWFERWDDAALLFCNHVETITVVVGGKAVRTLQVKWTERPESTAEIGGAMLPVHRRHARASDGRAWTVHTVAAPSPRRAQRAGRKKMGQSTPLGVALPLHDDEGGRLYAGLPLTDTQHPVRINAQFDPLTGRQGLASESPWNATLCSLVTDLWVGAALDLFETNPAEAWRVVPLREPSDDPKPSTVASLEMLLLTAARNTLPERLTFQTSGGAVPLTELAVEVPRLTGIVSDAELAELAGLGSALPAVVRDANDRWRDVLADWRTAGATLPQPITVETAFQLFDDETRTPAATVALAAAAVDEGLGDELAGLRCIVTEDGRHVRPPTPADPWLLAVETGGLASNLGLVARLHPEYQSDSVEADAVLGWLKERSAIVDPSDTIGVLRRLVASSQAGSRLATPLTDSQLRALRDAFESLNATDRIALGLGVGRAIAIAAYEYDRRGRRVATSASPADIYLPRSIDKEPESFAVAAANTPGLVWAEGRYADALRSSLGRTGLGAQRFLRLLGAETAPRLVLHPDLCLRYEGQKRGLSAHVEDSPPARAQGLVALGATYTLEDRDSPDLAAVLASIGSDRKATRRRHRAAAMLATLGRAWDRLYEMTEVPAASDYYSWNIKGTLRAFWVWRAATIPWLDDNTATPTSPADLRLRTPSTVAVHGPGAPGYIHKDVLVPRHDVLAALGVSGEPNTSELVKRLLELRDDSPDLATVATDAALTYLGLADRIAGRAHIPGDMTAGELRRAFASGVGLVRTNQGWRRPSQVLAGAPVFADRRAFAPSVPGAERLWTMLKIRQPSLDDCLAILAEVSRSRLPPEIADQTTALETLRLLANLVRDASLGRAARRRLAKLPLWTTKGWETTRPVYAIDDPTLAEGLGKAVPVWLPGGELAQFRGLLSHLHLSEVAGEPTAVVDPSAADVDEDATDLFRAAILLLHDDLARNDPATKDALDIGWDRLGSFQVRVSTPLRVRVEGLTKAPTVVPVVAKVDPDAGTLYLADPALLARVDGGGRAIAGLFAADRRPIAQAWLAACDDATIGRETQRLRLSQERAAEEEARTAADIADRLATFQHQTEAAHGRARTRRTASTSGASATRTGTTGAAPSPPTSPAPRVLVDPTGLRVADPRGRMVGGRATKSLGADVARGTRKPGSDLAEPGPGGAAPRHIAAPTTYTPGSKESVGLQLVYLVLASDEDDMRDLRAQHGVGADAVDRLERFFELKVYAGPEPDRVTLEESQIRRAMSTSDFFLVVVSGVEGQSATPRVRVIVDPLAQLEMTETSSVSFTGVRASHSLLYELVRDE